MATMKVGGERGFEKLRDIPGLSCLMIDFGPATISIFRDEKGIVHENSHSLGTEITQDERMAIAAEAGIYHRSHGERTEGQQIPEWKLTRFNNVTKSLKTRDVTTVRMLIATALETLHPDDERNEQFVRDYYPDFQDSEV